MKESTLDFEKMGGLVPAIIQDADTRNVLMLGFMNREAYEKTLAMGKVTFWRHFGRKARPAAISSTW